MFFPALSMFAVAAAGDGAALTLEQSVSAALVHRPRLAAVLAAEAAADARIDEARLKRLPELGLAAQINRSTGNSAPGAFFAAPGFVPVAGAPRGRVFDDGRWQTGLAAWASWDVLSLWRQASSIDLALAARDEAGPGRVRMTLANVGNPAWTYPVNAIYVFNSGPQDAVLLTQLEGQGRLPLPELEERLRARFSAEWPQVRFSFEAGDIVSQVLSFG